LLLQLNYGELPAAPSTVSQLYEINLWRNWWYLI